MLYNLKLRIDFMKKQLNRRKRQKAKVLLFFLTVSFLFTFTSIHLSNLSNIPLSSNSEGLNDINYNDDDRIYDKNVDYNHELEVFYDCYIQYSGGTQSLDDNNLLLIGVISLGTIFILEFSVVIKKITKKNVESNEETEYTLEDSDYLIKEESLILDIVKNYLDNNRYFEKEKVSHFINSRISRNGLNLNMNGIRAVLDSLIKKNIVVEGSKMIREEVLSNSNRREIYEYIKENPGAYSNKIVTSLGLSTFLVNWHIDMLVRFGFIHTEKIENFDAYYDSTTDPDYYELYHIISREKCSQIIDYLEFKEGGCTKYELSKELGMHPNTVSKYINKLDELGLLFSIQFLNKVVYQLNKLLYLEIC